MLFGVYAVRDVKSGFQTPHTQVNDQVAVRGFQSAVMQSQSELFTHASDFALYKIANYDSDHGTMIPLELPQLLVEASDCLR